MPTFLDGTLFSIILCALAGVALRYALFIGRGEGTDESERVRRQQQEFQERQRAFQEALDAAHRGESALRDKLERMQLEVQETASNRPQPPAAERAELVELDGSTEELRADISALRDEKEDLELQLSQAMLLHQETQRALTEAEGRCAATMAKLEMSGRTIAQLSERQSAAEQSRKAMLEAERTADEGQRQLRAIQSQLDAEQSQRHDLQQRLDERERTMVRLTTEAELAGELRQANDELDKRYEQIRQQWEELQREHADTEQQCTTLRQEVTAQQSARESLQASLSDGHQQRQRLSAELTAAVQLESVVDAQEREIAELASDRDELTRERHNLLAASQQNQQRIIELEQEASGSLARASRQDSLLRELRLEREEALTNLERERNERAILERQLAIQADGGQQLLTPAQQMDPLSSGILAEKHRKRTAVEGSVAAQGSIVSPSHQEGALLEQHAEHLRHRRDIGDTPRILTFLPQEAGTVEVDSLVRVPPRGLVYTRPPRRRDDLRRISGVGEILEKRMNELGIYTFAQIMQWQSTEVQEFSRLLGFRDRIERDQWVIQAQRLHREGATEAA